MLAFTRVPSLVVDPETSGLDFCFRYSAGNGGPVNYCIRLVLPFWA